MVSCLFRNMSDDSVAILGRGDRLEGPRRICFVPPNPPCVEGGRCSGLKGREDSFETSALGPVNGATSEEPSGAKENSSSS